MLKFPPRTLTPSTPMNQILVEPENSVSIDLALIRAFGGFVCDLVGLRGCELSVSFVTAVEMVSLNSTYRDKSKVTDVLSFPQELFEQPLVVGGEAEKCDLLLGDVVICVEEALKNAKRLGQSLEREVMFLLVHSILHLVGHDHINAEDEEIMLSQQRIILSKWSLALTKDR